MQSRRVQGRSAVRGIRCHSDDAVVIELARLSCPKNLAFASQRTSRTIYPPVASPEIKNEFVWRIVVSETDDDATIWTEHADIIMHVDCHHKSVT